MTDLCERAPIIPTGIYVGNQIDNYSYRDSPDAIPENGCVSLPVAPDLGSVYF